MSAVLELQSLLGTSQTVVGDDKASMVTSLLEQYRRLGEEEKKIAESRASVRAILVGLYKADTTELVVDSRVVATLQKETKTYVNVDMVKDLFAKVDYPELYNTSVAEVFRLKKVN
jgi:hypothetical protein